MSYRLECRHCCAHSNTGSFSDQIAPIVRSRGTESASYLHTPEHRLTEREAAVVAEMAVMQLGNVDASRPVFPLAVEREP